MENEVGMELMSQNNKCVDDTPKSIEKKVFKIKFEWPSLIFGRKGQT